ncbi:MAG: glycosyltransferase family 8 protein [Butyrivibrio sp.]|nr:glycosyltransferase family 8 protein [Butyrivibrio sp.]
MNVVTALNKKYLPYTVVMLTSLGINVKEKIDAYLLNSELSEKDIGCINAALSKYSINIHPTYVDKNNFSSKLPRNSQWTIETYYRLMMLELLPDTVNRALYLDGDIIVNKSVESLYEMEFGDKEIIACDDASGFNQMNHYGTKHQAMFSGAYDNGFRYFNAGVMLLNIDLLRKKYSFETYLKAFEEWNYEMEAPDQDILNWVHWKNVGFVDYSTYDLFARIAHNAEITYDEVKENVAIVHFAGEKPWENCNVHFDIEKLWWDYAKLTPYYVELLENFVSTAMTDKTVENYIKDIEKRYDDQSEMINKLIEKVKKLI